MRHVRSHDGAAHFSHLREFDRSPLHYKTACEAKESAPSPAMLLGTCVHAQLFGPQPGQMIVPWTGATRTGNAYKAFVKEHKKFAKSKKKELTVVSATTWERAKTIAESVKADPVAGPLLFALGIRHEVPLVWVDPGTGIECATRGIDALHVEKGYLVDFKTTTNAMPSYWLEHCWTMRYHVQAAMYEIAAKATGAPVRKLYCIGAEIDPPYAVTVLCYGGAPLIPTPGWAELDLLERGRRHLQTWLERLKQCEETDTWPPYQLDALEWTIPDRVLARMQAAAFQEEAAE